MSKTAFVADLHIANHRAWGGPVQAGLNRRAREALATLERALVRAGALGCDYFVVLGDLFDSDRPTPQLIAAVQQLFGECAGICSPLHVIVLRGNHDATSDTEGDDALGPLAPAVYSVVDTPRVKNASNLDLVAVPWRSGPAREWLPATLEKLLGVQASMAPFPRRVLALHLGLVNDDSPAYLRDAPDAVRIQQLAGLMSRYGIAFVVAGNHHQHKQWSLSGSAWVGCLRVIQCGTLIPHSFSDSGFDDVGKLVVYDTETGEVVVETIPGPRFVTTRPDEHRAFSLPPVPEGCAVYVRAVVAPEDLAVATEIAEGNPAYAGIEVLADDVGVAEQAREAAASTRSQVTLDEALAAYVEKMPLDECVKRAEVLERCRQFLKT